MSYAPPFTLNDRIVTLVADIAQQVGRVAAFEQLKRAPQLRKANRIKTIHSSLAIENNTLSLEQVTAVIEGKHVVAPAKDVLEVQNAIRVYERLEDFDPCSLGDLLRAHGFLMAGLVSEAGRFRGGNVGVFDGDKLVHAGTPAAYVPEVMGDLFAWLKQGSAHPLVASCVFHYEFEFVHPFQDGTGRMGRLWQTLILGAWNSLFLWLPVESLVKEHQREYYAVLARCDARADCAEFVEFMLKMISSALDEITSLSSGDGITDGITDGINPEAASVAEQERNRLLKLIEGNPAITMVQMAKALNTSQRKIERLVASLKKEGRLVRKGARRNGRWEVEDIR